MWSLTVWVWLSSECLGLMVSCVSGSAGISGSSVDWHTSPLTCVRRHVTPAFPEASITAGTPLCAGSRRDCWCHWVLCDQDLDTLCCGSLSLSLSLSLSASLSLSLSASFPFPLSLSSQPPSLSPIIPLSHSPSLETLSLFLSLSVVKFLRVFFFSLSRVCCCCCCCCDICLKVYSPFSCACFSCLLAWKLKTVIAERHKTEKIS